MCTPDPRPPPMLRRLSAARRRQACAYFHLPDPVFLDDIAVLTFVGMKVKAELDAFAAWEDAQYARAKGTVGFN